MGEEEKREEKRIDRRQRICPSLAYLQFFILIGGVVLKPAIYA